MKEKSLEAKKEIKKQAEKNEMRCTLKSELSKRDENEKLFEKSKKKKYRG